MLTRSSIISFLETWTRVCAMYLADAESTFATTPVNEGRPSEPGAGWITSAPMHPNFHWEHANEEGRNKGQTHDNGRICIVSYKFQCWRQGVWNVVDPPKFDIYPPFTSQDRTPKAKGDSLQADIGIVLLLGSEAFVTFQALGSNTSLHMKLGRIILSQETGLQHSPQS